MFSFWTGFIFGLATMFLVTLACAAWFVVQAANFHDSWLTEKENKKDSLT